MLIEKFPAKEEMKDEKYYNLIFKYRTSQTWTTNCFSGDTTNQEIISIMKEHVESEIERFQLSYKCSLIRKFEEFKYPTNIKLEEVKRVVNKDGRCDYKKVKNGFSGKFKKSKIVFNNGDGTKTENVSYYFVENRKADNVS